MQILVKFSQHPVAFIPDYVNTENVFYCLNVKLRQAINKALNKQDSYLPSGEKLNWQA